MDNRSSETELINSYGYYINSEYPGFLKRFGLTRLSIKAEGAVITDSEGKEYIDCVGGYGVCNLGHNDSGLINAIIEQLCLKQLNSKPFISEYQVSLAKLLSEITPEDLTCSFICNSGSEAIDSAIKLARLYTRKKRVLSAFNAFHGFTFGALTASGIPSFKSPFEPLLPGFSNFKFGDMESLRKAVTEDTAAVLLEPIQHEAGISLPPAEFFNQVQEFCNKNKILLIIDEIKTGFGKTGSLFACERFDIKPDILVFGKSLGGGLIPTGGLIAKKNIWKKFSFSFPMSASSYAGNALTCRVALETINILLRDFPAMDVDGKGKYILRALSQIRDAFPDKIRRVTGLGLLLGIEAVDSKNAFNLSKEMARGGVLAFPAFGNSSVIMLEPPLIISKNQIDTVIETIKNACSK
jgi:putrescine aminotransferase